VDRRRIERLQSLIKERVSEVILYELRDPRLGFVTVTKTKLSKDFKTCRVFYSCLGEEADREQTGKALERATRFIREEVGKILQTRTIPEFRFEFDESIVGTIQLGRVFKQIEDERAEDEAARQPPAPGDGDGEAS